jgi:nucleoside-diphosphate-sugar epimerase
MKVLVLGATGVLGRNVLPRLLERGHVVRALVRRNEQAVMLRRLGIEAVEGDILDPHGLHEAASGCDAALHLATAIPRSGNNADWTLNDRIRREGTANLLAASREAGIRRYLQQSIVALYSKDNDRLITEETPLDPAPPSPLRSASDMESLVKASPLEWTILRGGLFYGPGTHAEERWREAARDRTLAIPGDGGSHLSLIHVADMARAVVLAIESAPPASIYNVVDDEPVRLGDLYRYVAAQVEAPDPTPGGPPPWFSGRYGNGKIRGELGWMPMYATYRSGLAM